jgi:hypothetical protein
MASKSPVLLHPSQKRAFGITNRTQYVQQIDDSHRAYLGMSKLAVDALRQNIATFNFDRLSKQPKSPQKGHAVVHKSIEEKPKLPKDALLPIGFAQVVFGIAPQPPIASKSLKVPPLPASSQRATRYSSNSSWTHCSKSLIQANENSDQYIDEKVTLFNSATIL